MTLKNTSGEPKDWFKNIYFMKKATSCLHEDLNYDYTTTISRLLQYSSKTFARILHKKFSNTTWLLLEYFKPSSENLILRIFQENTNWWLIQKSSLRHPV